MKNKINLSYYDGSEGSEYDIYIVMVKLVSMLYLMVN